MAKAAILMATYNGGAHLREQIDSILRQTHTDWELYVSDDCSKDDTLQILTEYQKADSRICKIISNPGPHGAFHNYYHLMRHLKETGVCADYYFYCDQDDIWDPRKLQMQIARLSGCDSSKPALCNCDLALIDANGKSLDIRMSDYTDLELSNPYNLFFKHRYIWGTAMGHNKALWDKVQIPDDINEGISHDNFLGKYAVCYGTVVYEPEALVLYRRHGDNVSSLPVEHKITKAFPFRSFFGYYKSVTFCSLYFVYHAPSPTPFMEEYAQAIFSGGIRMLRFLKKHRIRVTEGLLSTAVFTLLYLTGLVKRDQRTKDKEYLYEKNQ